MKTLWNFVLFMAVLCMVGCSEEEEPQRVSFSFREVEVESQCDPVKMIVNANCSWHIQSDKRSLGFSAYNGTGTDTITITVPENDKYETVTYRATIFSDDRTSTDQLIVKQKEKPGLEMGNTLGISEAGGVIELPVKTNDKIVSVKTPDWITFTSSRALTGYTYTFTVEPNKTGEKRSGFIWIYGERTSDCSYISQDSYTPERIHLLNDFSVLTGNSMVSKIVMEPEYADWSKLDLVSGDNCTARIEDGYLYLSVKEYGDFDFSFMSGKSVLNKVSGMYLPKYPVNNYEGFDIFRGERMPISFKHDPDSYIITSSDESVVACHKDKTIEGLEVGGVQLEVVHKQTKISRALLSVTVEPFVILFRLNDIFQTGINRYEVEFVAYAKGKDAGSGFYSFEILDEKGQFVSGGYKELDIEDDKISIYTWPMQIRRENVWNLREAVSGYKIRITSIIDGREFVRESEIDIYSREMW